MKTKTKRERYLHPIETTPAFSKHVYLALSFVFPFAIMGIAFALHGMYPFGNRLILRWDAVGQFYPFLSNFWHKFREGSLAPWSWTAGAGYDYVAFFAYYLASPLNLLAVLAPHAWLRETATLLLLIKIGCAGLFAGIFLRYTFRQYGPHCGMALPVFSTLYALCAYTLGYYALIFWFDSIALLPLVMLGLRALINEGKYRLYVVSLVLAILANYQIGFFICVFVAITFFGHCIIQKLNCKDFLRKLGLITAYSALAIGMTAILLIPTRSALQSTILRDYTFPSEVFLFDSFFDVLGNFIAFLPPTVMSGLPNLYSGMIAAMLAGLFVFSPKISRREKIVLTGLVAFLVISCNINVLEYVWNGFNLVYGIPSRYSFLISFLLVVMAYRAFIYTENISRQGLLAMGISAALFLLPAVFGSQGRTSIVGSAVLCSVYLLLLFFMGKCTGRIRQLMEAAFFLVIVIELSIGSWIGISTNGTTSRDEYPYNYEQIQALLSLRQPAGIDFYRTDIELAESFNGPYLYNYNGISIYSSTVNVNTAEFMHGFGLLGREKFFYYSDTTPLFNAFLSMRYVIKMGGRLKDNGICWETAGETGNAFLQENKYYLPLGFMVKKDLAGYIRQEDNPFLAQNDLFSRATGIEGSLFTVTNITETVPGRTQNMNGEGILIWSYTMPSDGLLYVYTECQEASLPGVFVNDVFLDYIYTMDDASYISTVGSFTQGDIITLAVMEGSDIFIQFGYFDLDLFERGYARLASQPLNLTKFTETRVSGHVTAIEDGLLYTSIPGDRNWSVYVNGAKSSIVLIDGVMAAVSLSKGTHEVEFRYFNKSFLVGIIISLASLAIFVVLLLADRLKRP